MDTSVADIIVNNPDGSQSSVNPDVFLGTPNGYPLDGGVTMTAPANNGSQSALVGLNTFLGSLNTAVNTGANIYRTLDNTIEPAKSVGGRVTLPQPVATAPWYENKIVLIGGGVALLIVVVLLAKR
jgi:hypothetical protein